MLLGVISDTHGLLRPRAMETLRVADAIIHAGDVGTPAVLAALGALGPPVLAVVQGNVDAGPWAQDLPDRAVVAVGGCRVLVLHDRHTLDFYPAPTDVDLVISGHSHRPGWEWLGGAGRGGTWFLNPGAAGPRRFRLPVCMALVRVENGGGTCRTRFVDLDG